MMIRTKGRLKTPHPYRSRFSLYSTGRILCAIVLFALLLIQVGASRAPADRYTSPPVDQQPDNQLVYVALGASDTFGFGTDDPYQGNWAVKLASRLGTEYRLVNLGIPGILIDEALKVELPVALDAGPDLITVWLAVNDIAARVPVESYAQDLDQLLSRLRAGVPQARIAVANVPDITLLPYFYLKPEYSSEYLQTQIQAYNDAISEVVIRHQALLIDIALYNDDLKYHPEYISVDGLHPTEEGYARLAELFYQALQEPIN